MLIAYLRDACLIDGGANLAEIDLVRQGVPVLPTLLSPLVVARVP